MKAHQLGAMTLDELVQLRDEIADTILRRAYQELVFAENRVNELRILAGMKKRPVSKAPEMPKRRPRMQAVA